MSSSKSHGGLLGLLIHKASDQSLTVNDCLLVGTVHYTHTHTDYHDEDPMTVLVFTSREATDIHGVCELVSSE